MSNDSDIVVSQYGIGKRIVSITPFDGFDPSKLSAFKQDISVYLFEKGISLPTSKVDPLWLEMKQIHYAEKTNSSGKVTAAILAGPQNLWMIESGYAIDDCLLNVKGRRSRIWRKLISKNS